MIGNGDPVLFRELPDGDSVAGVVGLVQGQRIRVDYPQADSLRINSPMELSTSQALYLGVVQQLESGSFWLLVEHYLDREELTALKKSWSGTD